MEADVVTFSRIDRALLDLADGPLTSAKLDALTVAWIKLDTREQGKASLLPRRHDAWVPPSRRALDPIGQA